jgi:hypothetical protein
LWPFTEAPVVNICGFTSDTDHRVQQDPEVLRPLDQRLAIGRFVEAVGPLLVFSVDKKLNGHRRSALTL